MRVAGELLMNAGTGSLRSGRHESPQYSSSEDGLSSAEQPAHWRLNQDSCASAARCLWSRCRKGRFTVLLRPAHRRDAARSRSCGRGAD